jgi:hypothetical protein
LRVLEHDLHVAAAFLGVVVNPLELARRRFDQPHQQLRQGALATAGLAHDAQGFAGTHLKVDAVQGVGQGFGPTEPVLAHGVMHAYVFKAQNDRVFGRQ